MVTQDRQPHAQCPSQNHAERLWQPCNAASLRLPEKGCLTSDRGRYATTTAEHAELKTDRHCNVYAIKSKNGSTEIVLLCRLNAYNGTGKITIESK